MSLQNIQKLRKERGFTIVELLIVIVVIGILAAIVIVAYQNVVRNANDSNDKSNATSLAKVAEAVNADASSSGYPTGTDDATLTASFNGTSTTKLPSNLSVKYVASGTTVSNTNFAAIRDDAASSAKLYWVKVCAVTATTNGLNIYYPIRASSTVSKINVGMGCAS